ncbi:MAG: hypothetical protein HYX87_04545 [Chloroflexi bacterium]|nr:hypothetical protein [Chloroflexota bacterium]
MGLYGYAGKILRVDLDKGQFSFEHEDPTTLRKYLGGAGLGTKILYDEVRQGVKWSDSENRLVLCSGPLGGVAKGSGNFSVITKGPLTEGATSTQANGYFGAYLRFAGFDGIIIQGKAKGLSYLYVHDGKAELRDASHLAGKDTWETEDLIKQESGTSQQAMTVFSIGPAGENLVRFAALVGDRGHVAGHNGVGAVIGSKDLKAIAIARSKVRINVFDPHQLSSLCKKMLDTIKDDALWSRTYHWGTLTFLVAGAAAGNVAFKNYTMHGCPLTKEQLKTFDALYLRQKLTLVRHHPCWACQMHHCDIIRIPDGPYAGLEGEEPEYEGYAAMGTQIGNYDGMAATALSNEVDRLGLEMNETGWVLGMVMEGYENGLLNRKDTDGLEMTWGNVQAARAMINKISRREGIGNILAEGVMRASQSLGRGMAELAIHSKQGNTPLSHDHRNSWSYLFDTSVSDTGTNELHVQPRASCMGLNEPTPYSPPEIASFIAKVRGVTPFIDCLGVCRQANREVPELLVGMLNAVTGWDFTWEEAMQVGLRVVNLFRAFNVRHGYKPDAEAPSPRYCSIPVDGPAKGKDITSELEKMSEVFYREMGWDRASGKPLPETLRGLDLASIVPDIWAVSRRTTGDFDTRSPTPQSGAG